MGFVTTLQNFEGSCLDNADPRIFLDAIMHATCPDTSGESGPPPPGSQRTPCNFDKFDETIQDVDIICCNAEAVEHTGHRRSQQDDAPCTNVPETCDTACAAVFAPFFDSCRDMLSVAEPFIIDSLEALYGQCLVALEAVPAGPPPPPPVTPQEAAEQFSTVEASDQPCACQAVSTSMTVVIVAGL